MTGSRGFSLPVGGETTTGAQAKADAAITSTGVFYVDRYGAAGDGTTDDKAAFDAAFTAASAVNGEVRLGPKTYAIDGGFALSGYNCSIAGTGSSYVTSGGARPVGSVIKAINQTGPVLDFTGFAWPTNYMARLHFKDFAVIGDGTAGTAKKGMYLPGNYPGAVPIALTISDIAISNCGGIHFDASDMYFDDVRNVTVSDPISCVANNVPYARILGCNGATFTNLGLRSRTAGGTAGADDVPAAGALLIDSSGTFMFHRAELNAPWFENLHVGTGKSIVVQRTNCVAVTDPVFFDCYRVTGATSTSHWLFEDSPIGNTGGNTIRGVIPGRGTDTASTIDYGVVIRQKGNSLLGVKGYRGYNAVLDPGVTYTSVYLTGAEAGSVGWPGWVDNSANTQNTLIDHPEGVWILGSQSGTPTVNLAGTTIRVGTGTPEAAVVGALGDLYLRKDPAVGTTIYGKALFAATNVGWYPTLQERLSSASLGASQTTSFASSPAVKYTLTANITFTSITNARTGGRYTFMIAQDATGGRTLGWPSNVKWAGGAAPTLSTAANAVDVFEFMYDGTNWREVSRALEWVALDGRLTVAHVPADRGYLAWTQPPNVVTGSTVVPTAGLLHLRRIRRVPAGSVTSIIAYVGAVGVTLTSGQCFAALYDAAGTLIGQTSDQAVAWVSAGLKTMTLTGGPFTVTAADYYIGVWFNGTTGPSFGRSGTVNATLTNAGLAAPNLEAASANTSITTAAPTPFGTQTGTLNEWWFALA